MNFKTNKKKLKLNAIIITYKKNDIIMIIFLLLALNLIEKITVRSHKSSTLQGTSHKKNLQGKKTKLACIAGSISLLSLNK
jgi:hypothetical protein